MRIEARLLVAPVLAVASLAIVGQLTAAALRISGAWRRPEAAARVTATHPYAALDQALALRSAPAPEAPARNPFAFGGAEVAPQPARTTSRRPAPPAPPPVPLLTSIVWDHDPRATVRWDGREYSIRPNSLFADFRVVSISRERVTLDRNGETLVLTLRPSQP
jgi:hypothetical protein